LDIDETGTSGRARSGERRSLPLHSLDVSMRQGLVSKVYRIYAAATTSCSARHSSSGWILNPGPGLALPLYLRWLKDHQSKLIPLSDNLVDIVWGSDRPARALNHVFPLLIEFTGITPPEVARLLC